MGITRRRLLKTTGAVGAAALTTSAKARLLGGAVDASPRPSGAITTRTFTNISGAGPVPLGTPFRFGLGLKRGDVPSGVSLTLKDGAGGVLSAQFDAINYWPDGSVRFCEARGYTARAIAAGRSDTISVFGAARGFDNALPGGKTPSQLLAALQSFKGAQDLIIECDSMASCSGASNTYTTGKWLAHFNTLLAGPNVQQINKGPCCMGFRAWGQLTNGSINHAHIHVAVYLWLWLNPSSGAIQDVEYLVYLHNSLLTRSTDGSSYATFPPDRYNYSPALKNGTAVIASLTLHPGTASTVGGHHIRAGWFTARADGKPRWIAGTLEAPNLQITLDPVQANPQANITARSHLLSTDLLPKYDIAGVNCGAPPTGATTPISYAPMVKGLWTDEAFSDWDTTVGIDTGGSHASIGMIPQWNVRDLMLQTVTTAQNHRVSALGWATIPRMYLETNGRIPNLRNQAYTGMTAAQPTTVSTGDDPGVHNHYNVALSTESAAVHRYSYGNWGAGYEDTSHWPNGAYYTYLMEGGAHNRDIVLMGAGFALISKAPDKSIYPGGRYPPPSGFNHAGPSYTNRTPTLSGKTYYSNVIGSTLAPREDAWALRELVFAAAIAPASLADGSAFGEGGYFKDALNDTLSYGAALLNILPANQVNNGFWVFQYNNPDDTISQSEFSSGSTDPWMQSYLGEAFARAKLLHGGESFGSAATAMCDMHKKFFEGILGGSFCTFLSSAQTINVKNGRGLSGTFLPGWSKVGKFPTPAYSSSSADVWMWADFTDTSTGWITLRQVHGSVPSWPEVPFDAGASLYFTQDYFDQTLSGNVAPSPLAMERIYYVVASDPANGRIKVGAKPGGTTLIPSATATNVLWCVVDTSSCPATYVPVDFPSVTLAYLTFNIADGRMADLVRVVRTYRTAGDSAALQRAETNGTARLAAKRGIDFSGWPMGKVLV